MISLRNFAKNNRGKTRLILTLIHLIIPFLAICFGGLLYDVGWELPNVLIPVLITIFFFAYYFYPSKKRKSNFFKYYYLQKSLDFTFVMISFFLIATSFNGFLINPPENHTNSAKPELIVLKPHNTPAKDNIFTKPFKKIKEVRKQIRKEIKTWKKNKQSQKDKKSRGVRILLIILTLIVAIVLGFLVLMLGCSLSCSGNEALAAVVTLGGLVGLIIGTSFVIRAITRMKDKPKNR